MLDIVVVVGHTVGNQKFVSVVGGNVNGGGSVVVVGLVCGRRLSVERKIK